MNCPDAEVREILERLPQEPLPFDRLKRLSDRSRNLGRHREAEIIDLVGLSLLASLVLTRDRENASFGAEVCTYALKVSRKQEFLGCRARFSYLLGEHAYRNLEYERARELLTESDYSYTRLCETDEESYSPALASTLHSLGNLLADTEEFTEAEQAMSRAIDLLQQLATVKPQQYSKQLAPVLNNLGTLLGKQRRFSDALEVLEKAERLPRDPNDLECKAALAATLTNKARALAEDGKPAAGIDAAEQSVRLRRELAHQAPERHMAGLAAALINLSMLSGQTGTISDAFDSAKEAISILSGLLGQSPQYVPHLAVAMNNLAKALLDSGYPDEGQQLHRRGTDLYTTLAAVGPTAFQSDMARFLDRLEARIDAKGDSRS
ncbi:tetratricopeptide repeat protein [Planctomycetota bacterium]